MGAVSESCKDPFSFHKDAETDARIQHKTSIGSDRSQPTSDSPLCAKRSSQAQPNRKGSLPILFPRRSLAEDGERNDRL